MREIMPLARPHLTLASASIAALASAFVSQTALAANCELQEIASIPATLTADNRLQLDSTINGVPAKFDLDTGAAISALSDKFAARLDMPVERASVVFYGLTGRPLDRLTHVREMRLGGKTSANAAFLLMPIGGDGADGNSVGLFGVDYLQNYDVEIDVAGGKVNLFSQDHCPGKLVHWSSDFFKTEIYYRGQSASHNPMLDIAVDGKNLRALLDTGAPLTAMRMASARDRFGLTPDSPGMQRLADTHGVEGRNLENYEHTFSSMTFGDITLHHTVMQIIPIGAHVAAIGSHIKQDAVEEPDVLIGMSLLKQLHLVIAYSENAIYYTVAAPKQAASQ
jgi:predicted aspartyl protease